MIFEKIRKEKYFRGARVRRMRSVVRLYDVRHRGAGAMRVARPAVPPGMLTEAIR